MIEHKEDKSMQTIIITLNASQMSNPDLDIRYLLPQRIEEYSNGVIKDNGYDYISDNELGIWLSAEHAEEAAEMIVDLISGEHILGNDLTVCCCIYISPAEDAEPSDCRQVFPLNNAQ